MKQPLQPLIKQGWLRALLFLLVWLIFAFSLDVGASMLIKLVWPGTAVANGDNIQTLFRFSIAAAGSTLLVWGWRKLADRKTFKSLGFEWKDYKYDAWKGFFAAPVIIGLGTIVLLALQYIQYFTLNFSPDKLLIQLVLMVLIAYSEELIVRGYLLNNLMQSFNKWIALSITAVFFAVMHLANPDVSVLSFVNILMAGILLGVNYIYTKNLWFGIFFHFSWNFFQGPLFGYEVSGINFSGLFGQSASGPVLWTGGNFGFEGSLVCIILIVLAIIIFSYHFSRQHLQGNNIPI